MAGPSEFDLIRRFMERVPTAGAGLLLGSGDDAAVVEPRRATATSVDSIVEGVHFTRPGFSPESIGRKALAAALSDLAAMGAEAGEAYVALGAPPGEDEDTLLGIADGVGDGARREGVVIAGGDFTGSATLFVSVTVVGIEPSGASFVGRAGASAGESVVMTGAVGGAAAALEELARGPSAGVLAIRQLDPRARLREGRALAAAGATAMIDVSDGTLTDAGHIAAASGVGIELDYRRLPIEPAVRVGRDEREVAALALAGGEDFELIACLPEAALDRAAEEVAEAGTELTVVGSVTAGEGAEVTGSPADPAELRGFDHRSA